MALYILTAEQGVVGDMQGADRPQLNVNNSWSVLTGTSISPSFIIFYAIWTAICLYLWTENGCLKATEHIIIPVEWIIDPEIVVSTETRQEATLRS